MKTPQVTPDWEVGIWNARVIMTDQTEEPETEPRCPQCGATSRWVRQRVPMPSSIHGLPSKFVAAECDTCEARWNETTTQTERTSR